MKFKNGNIFETILHFACISGNLEFVKYIISLNKIDITSKTISICFSFHFNHNQFNFISIIINIHRIFTLIDF